MKRLKFASISLLMLVATRLEAGTYTPSSSYIQVHDFVITGQAPNVLYETAEKYQVVIGIYGTFVNYQARPVNISIKNGTLKDVFDAVVSADPQLEWHETKKGSVHFINRRAPLPLMDVIVESFDARNPKSGDMYGLVSNIPEIHRWLRIHKCPTEATTMMAGSGQTQWEDFSVHARNVPLFSIFDEVAAKSHTYFWSVMQIGSHSCAINMQLREPEPWRKRP